tara:strand:+ start:31690 stop:33114 length:1425 start_codon:yes stop_codon:yes gene_type:complete
MKENISKNFKVIHFVGIGGSGMSGIAEVLHNLGFIIQGSDLIVSESTRRLSSLGIKIYRGHSKKNIDKAELIVVSSAILEDNIEIQEGKDLNIPIIKRAEMLAELMRFRHGIAVSGTHGKTTTTSLIACILDESNLDPTYIIGGKLHSTNTSAKLGSGNFLVAEADESDTSFLHLQPKLSVVTNIDTDHLENYGSDIERLRTGFVDFIHNLPFDGTAVMCIDDNNVKSILDNISRRIITYGFDQDAEIRAAEVKIKGIKTYFKVYRKGKLLFTIKSNLPGVHNIQNSLAAIAIALQLNISKEIIKKSLDNFSGIDRRFQIKENLVTENGIINFIDDYAHHPSEINSTIKAIRDIWPERRIVTIFQPHRYSRTKQLFDDFVESLSKVDFLIVTEIFSAGEKPISGINGKSLTGSIRLSSSLEPVFLSNLDLLPEIIKKIIVHNDILLTMGAGDIGLASNNLFSSLKARKPVGIRS